MRVTPLSVPFESVYRKLVVDYLNQSSSLAEYIEGFPSPDAVKDSAKRKQFSTSDRATLTAEIRHQYGGLPICSELKASIDKLSESTSRTITTGHQLNLFTGPSFMITKICNAVALAHRMNQYDSDHHYVPVFWMATEDHDFEEINHTFFHGERVGWDSNQKGAVGRFRLDDLGPSLEDARALLGTSFDEEAWGALEKAYQQPTLAQAVRAFVNELFGTHGLIIIDGDSPVLKGLFADQISEEVEHQKAEMSIGDTCQKLKEKGYKIQANPRSVNGFLLEENARKRLDAKDGVLSVIDGDMESQAIRETIAGNPEKFSPNAVFRPLYQERVLPNVAYIGGAGEISYWLELKKMFDDFGIEFPTLIVRNSIWVINPAVSKKLDKLGLAPAFFFGDIEPKKKQWVAERSGFDLRDELSALETLFEGVKTRMIKIDSTLERAVDGEKTRSIKGLTQLEKKAISRLKAAHETDIARIDWIHSRLFPSGIPQERRENIFALVPSIREHIQSLVEHCNPLENQFYILETGVS